MLLSFSTGLLLAVLTVAIHAFGSTALIQTLIKKAPKLQSRSGELLALSMTAATLLVMHTIETAVWAITYLLVVGAEQFKSFEEAVYFSTVTFTTLGYGDIVIQGSWRLLSAIQAMVGLLIFGWSTALFFAVVTRILQNRWTIDK